MLNTVLTEKEVMALNGILASEYMNGLTGLEAVDRFVWTWSANPFDNKRSFAGAISKLSQRKMVKCINSGTGRGASIAITKRGYKALMANSGGAPSRNQGQEPARKPVEAPKPVTEVRIPSKPWEAPGNAPGRPSAIVTAKAPRKRGPAAVVVATKPEPVAHAISLGGIIKLHWRDAIIIAEVIAETAKAWKLVAINNESQSGIECWFPKSAFENIKNSDYQLAEWFYKYCSKFTYSWLWSSIG